MRRCDLVGEVDMNYEKITKKVAKQYGVDVEVSADERSVFLRGQCGNWADIVAIGKMYVTEGKHVVNDIQLIGHTEQPERLPKLTDSALDGTSWDVVVIGGGISGCAVARELTRYKLKVLLVEKHSDVARGASGANNGMVHAGIDLKHQCLKLKYGVGGNAIYGDVCKELGVDFRRSGQYVIFDSKLIRFFAKGTVKRATRHGIPGVRILGKDEIAQVEPAVKDFAVGALYAPSTGYVSPYQLTIAYAENAVQNGATVSLNTAVLGMEMADGLVAKVVTNRGTLSAKCVVNCAGVFADKVAAMAGDRYFSIHPRRGTDLMLDPKAEGVPTQTISMGPSLKSVSKFGSGSTKGGGVIRTADGNYLLGPDAVEIPDREDTSTNAQSLANVFAKHSQVCPTLRRSDIIAYFSGVRAPTYEEDFIIERSAKVANLVHVAGIQSPGITAAPLFSKDVAEIVRQYLLSAGEQVVLNDAFDPVRPRPVKARQLDDDARDKLIQSDPDFGKIICRCEEISLGEIKQALHNPLGVHTIDGVKRRVRAGMGRCQGGFCMPLITDIIAKETNGQCTDVAKDDIGSNVAVGKIKEV